MGILERKCKDSSGVLEIQVQRRKVKGGSDYRREIAES